jgi:hypothetical protein
MCNQSLDQSAKPDHVIVKKNESLVPKLLSREPGSPLYVIVDPENFEKTSFWGKKKETTEVNPHGLDLSTLDKSSWAELFTRIGKHYFALSSFMMPSLQEMLEREEKTYVGLFLLSETLLTLELPDTGEEYGSVFDLTVTNVNQAIEVASDFLHHPSQLLELHAWVNFNDKPDAPSSNSNRAAYVAPITTTTFIATDGFEF